MRTRVSRACVYLAMILIVGPVFATGCARSSRDVEGVALTAERAEAAERAIVNVEGADRLALEGYDPVSYFGSGPRKGRADLTGQYLGATYRFVNEQNRAAFIAEPLRYAPAYGGWCASAMADSGSRVDIDPENYSVNDGRLFLFFRLLFIDARGSWEEDPTGSRARADANWSRLLASEAADQADGAGQ